jgi:mannan endo-1,6-alpha-mannosidase
MSYYHGNEPGQIPGILPGPPDDGKGPYYWWEGGALWGTMVDYWHYTKDTTYNNDTEQSLVWQAGAPTNSYMPPNWTASLGNDDQGFWGMSAMLAAETNFQNPPAKDPQWLALAQAVFNTQAARWDTEECNGGLRWQVHYWAPNGGYNYKNSIATGIFFNLGARLARYTGNATYAQWATDAWTWTQDVGYIDKNYNIYDGAQTGTNCTDFNLAQYSYAPAVFIQGAGFMYNYVSVVISLSQDNTYILSTYADTPWHRFRPTDPSFGPVESQTSPGEPSRSSFPTELQSNRRASEEQQPHAQRTLSPSRATCSASLPRPQRWRPSCTIPS